MEDRISMAAKQQITFRFKAEYEKASKKDKGVILDRMCETRANARRSGSAPMTTTTTTTTSPTRP